MKKLFKILFSLALVIVLAVVASIVFIDQAAKAAVERGGTFALGVPTHLGSADVSLLRGRLGLESLQVANPPGFKNENFLALAKGELELDMKTLRKETLVVPHLLLEGIALDLARNDGGTNFGVVLDHLQRFESKKKPSEPAPKEEGKKVILREVVIRGTTVSLDIGQSIAGFQSTTFTLPEIVLRDLGSESGGDTISSQFSKILRALLDKAMESGASLIPPDLLADLQNRLGQLGQLDQLPGALLDEGKQQLQETLDELKQKAGDAKQQLGEEWKKASSGSQDALKKAEEDAKKQLGGSAQDLLKKKPGGT